MLIDPRQLSILLAIHRHGSFKRAAEAFGLSQPALSASVAALEHAVGHKVLDRTPKGASLNELGRKLALHAETLENTLRIAADDVNRHINGAADRLSIGGTPIALIKYAVPALSSLLDETPLSVDLTEAAENELTELLRTGHVDLIIGTMGADKPQKDLVEIPLTDVTLSIFMRKHHPLAKQKRIKLSDVANWSGAWALPTSGSGFRHQVETALVANGVAFPRDYISCHTISVQKEFALRSDCITILPPEATTIEMEGGLLLEIPLPTGRTKRVIGIKHLKHRKLSAAATRFIAAAQAIA